MIPSEIEKQLISQCDPEGSCRTSQKYSYKDRHVYTQEGENYHWLTISCENKDVYSVSKTDSTGLITMRDRYRKDENLLRCISKERLVTKRGRSVLELLRQSKRETERAIIIGQDKPKNKGDRSLWNYQDMNGRRLSISMRGKRTRHSIRGIAKSWRKWMCLSADILRCITLIVRQTSIRPILHR